MPHCYGVTDGGLTKLPPPRCVQAPEQWDPLTYGPPGPASDVWAFGCLLCDLGTGQPVWRGLPQEQVLKRVIVDLATPALPPPCAPALRRAAEMCLRHDPAARPSIAQVRMWARVWDRCRRAHANAYLRRGAAPFHSLGKIAGDF